MNLDEDTEADIECFDSKLVRLKVIAALSGGAIFAGLFRFQTGSIKSENGNGRKAEYKLFRFQTGSIKSRRVSSILSMILWKVSIPNWFD